VALPLATSKVPLLVSTDMARLVAMVSVTAKVPPLSATAPEPRLSMVEICRVPASTVVPPE
jgi:hypothetical protein